ncbi:MAG TPA: hypothetical protein ENI08_02915 [Candidatus Dependentiae bacterium]|nr:hypothetical protein [Candidatus Dependentiae bacterium]
MKNRIYILLSFSIAVSCHAVESESFEEDNLIDELWQIRNNADKKDERSKEELECLTDINSDRRQSGVRPGEIKDPRFGKYDQNEVACSDSRENSKKHIENKPGLLKLGNEARAIESAARIKKEPKQSVLEKLWTKFRAALRLCISEE